MFAIKLGAKRYFSSYKPLDLSLTLITKREKDRTFFIEKVLRAVKGGVKTVIIEEADQRSCLLNARLLAQMLPDKVQLIVRNHFFVATVAKTGLQFGESRASIYNVEAFFKGSILGAKAKTKKDVFDAEKYPIDYLAVPLPIWGIEGLRWVRHNSSHSILAEGPIHLYNLEEVCKELDLRIDGVGVTDALWDSKDPIVTAREMQAILQKVKSQRNRPATT